MITAQQSSENVDLTAAIEEAAKRVVQLRLEVPAVFFLEMNKPLVTVYHTGAIFLSPFASAIFGARNAQLFTELFSDRSHIEQLIVAIESAAGSSCSNNEKIQQ